MAGENDLGVELDKPQWETVKCPLRGLPDDFNFGRVYTSGRVNIGELFNPEQDLSTTAQKLYTFTKGPDAKTVRNDVELSGPIPKIPDVVYLVTEGVSGVNILRVDKFGEVIDGLSSKYAGVLKGKLLDREDLIQLAVTLGSNLPTTLGNSAQRIVKVLSVEGSIYTYDESSLPVDDTIISFSDMVSETEEVKENLGGVPTFRERLAWRSLGNVTGD